MTKESIGSSHCAMVAWYCGIIIATIFFAANWPSAWGCECADSPYPKRVAVARSFQASSIVFTGTVESMEIRTHWEYTGIMLDKPQLTSYLLVHFKALQVFKGSPKRGTIVVTTGSGAATSLGAGDCGFPFRLRETYIVYATYSGEEYAGLPSTSICTETKLLEDASADLRHIQGQPPTKEDTMQAEELNKILDRRANSRVCGQVRESGGNPLAEGFVRFWVRKGNTYRRPSHWLAIVQDGKYCTNVEPGTYFITAESGYREKNYLIGYKAEARRLEESTPIVLKAGQSRNDADITVRPESQFREYSIKGKVEVSEGIRIPAGQFKMRISRDWDERLNANCLVEPDGSFEVKSVPAGRVRLVPELEPVHTSDTEAWSISVPEVEVPVGARNVRVLMKKESLRERATHVAWTILAVIQGKVTAVIEGDKIEIASNIDGASMYVRLKDIDCPDLGQDFADVATSFATSLLLGKQVSAIVPANESDKGPLRYDDGEKYWVAEVLVEHQNASVELIKAGLAWYYDKYSRDPECARLAEAAQKARVGLWSNPNSTPPWEYRKGQKR